MGKIRYIIKGHSTGGGSNGILTLEEETGDTSFILGLSKEALRDRKIKTAEIKLSEGMHPEYSCFRYEQPIELTFEVTE